VFHKILSKEQSIYAEDLDMYIADLEILTENRNLKDIIFISDSFRRHLKQLRNGVPVKTFFGNKKDYSLVSVVRYLKSFMRVKDIREKI
jgi:TFIIF-interacting CTD phosphatase-like protein